MKYSEYNSMFWVKPAGAMSANLLMVYTFLKPTNLKVDNGAGQIAETKFKKGDRVFVYEPSTLDLTDDPIVPLSEVKLS